MEGLTVSSFQSRTKTRNSLLSSDVHKVYKGPTGSTISAPSSLIGPFLVYWTEAPAPNADVSPYLWNGVGNGHRFCRTAKNRKAAGATVKLQDVLK